jgi:hypothetical protein
MGMYDYITCEMVLPDGKTFTKDELQTKSLGCTMDHFTITTLGRLIYHPYRLERNGDREIMPTVRIPAFDRIPLDEIDMEYHGDLAMCGEATDGTYIRYAIRFTHGTVEWVRYLDTLSEIHRQWFLERFI